MNLDPADASLSKPFADNVDWRWTGGDNNLLQCATAREARRSCAPCHSDQTARIVSNGAVEKTRTSTGCPTATSTLRVYQFRHDRLKRRPDVTNRFRAYKATGQAGASRRGA
jgi:hypothetical protein